MSGLPDFVVVGAQKAASTLLADCLGEHPAIAMPSGETPDFRDPEYKQLRLAELASRIPDGPSVIRRGIKCPDYLARPECAPRLQADLHTPDVLVIFRDPIKRAVSAYYWRVRWGRLPLEPADVGLRRILDGSYDECYPHAREILDWGRYAEHLSRYLVLFPPAKVHTLLDDDLRTDAAASLSRLYAALGVDPTFRPTALGRVSNAGIYNPARLRLLARVARKVVQEDPAGTTAATIRRPALRTARGLSYAATVGVDRLVLARFCDNSRPGLSPDLERALAAFYDDDLVRLETMIGRDLTHWRRPVPPGPTR